MQKSLIRINTFQRYRLIASVTGGVFFAHALLGLWLWGFKPEVQKMEKLLEALQVDARVNSLEIKRSAEAPPKKMVPVRAPKSAKAITERSMADKNSLGGARDKDSSLNTDEPRLIEPSPELNDSRSGVSQVVANEDEEQPSVSIDPLTDSTAPKAAAPIAASSSIELGLTGKKVRPAAVTFTYDAYLNGAKVAIASYELTYPKAETPDLFEASFRLRATGLTALIWRGERIETSTGVFDESGLSAQRLRQVQGDRPARLREVSPGATDSVSSVFQLMVLGNSFGEELTKKSGSFWYMQKNSRVDKVSVKIGKEELAVFRQNGVKAIPISLSDESNEQTKPDLRTIWFVPALEWLPIRLLYSDGKYDVELRMQGMPAPVSRAPDSP